MFLAQGDGMPVWAQVGLAVIGLAGAYVAFRKQQDANVWKHIGALQKENEGQALRIDALERHVDRLEGEKEDLKREVDSLCVELGRPTKYFVRPKTP